MDFTKVEEFARQHWPAALMVVLITTPSVWAIAQMHFSERITVLEMKVKELTEKVAVLNQLAERSREKLAGAGSSFDADELFTPSNPVEAQDAK
jgi:hypothetical protein